MTEALDKAVRRFCADLLTIYPLLKKAAGAEGGPGRRLVPARVYIEAVEDLLDSLDPGDLRLVELKFFRRRPAWDVAGELTVDESTLYRRQAQILARLAIRLGL